MAKLIDEVERLVHQPERRRQFSIANHPGVYAEDVLGFNNEPFHWEWHELEMTYDRLTVVAPREHAKSEVYSVIGTAHKAIYEPGSWTHLFSATVRLSEELVDRVIATISRSHPWMIDNAPRFSKTDLVFSNWSRITVGSVGRAVRGLHPDRIVGDDILDETRTGTNLQRRRLEAFWLGAVGPMAHPGVYRPLGWGNLKPHGKVKAEFHPATKIILVGTPFHELDLLMSMKQNPIYQYRRYAAQFSPSELIPGTWAIDASPMPKAA